MTEPSPAFFDICMLSHANWEDTERALRSAWRHGVHVHLGITVDADCPFSHPLLTVYACPWPGQFAAARNVLWDQVTSDAPYIMWLDSDEELICRPASLPVGAGGMFMRVRISNQVGVTGCDRESMHRNDPDVRWVGAVHERLGLVSGGPQPPRMVVPGIGILHHGYEDRDYEVRKLTRNALIAQKAIDAGSVDPGDSASIARERTALGHATAFDWLANYHQNAAWSQARGASLDNCWEAASALAFCGYTRPAEELVAMNPLNMPMQLTLLIVHYARTGQIERDRFAVVLASLQRNLWDTRFVFDAILINMSDTALEAHIAAKAQELDWSLIESTERGTAMAPETVYQQSDDILLETFEDDTLLLSSVTNRVVSLNAAGTVFWDALAQGSSVVECAALIAEATETPVTPEALTQIEGFFQNLLDSGMIREA